MVLGTVPFVGVGTQMLHVCVCVWVGGVHVSINREKHWKCKCRDVNRAHAG